MAHKLNIEAVHKRTSNEIQISQSTQPSCQEPKIIKKTEKTKEIGEENEKILYYKNLPNKRQFKTNKPQSS